MNRLSAKFFSSLLPFCLSFALVSPTNTFASNENSDAIVANASNENSDAIIAKSASDIIKELTSYILNLKTIVENNGCHASNAAQILNGGRLGVSFGYTFAGEYADGTKRKFEFTQVISLPGNISISDLQNKINSFIKDFIDKGLPSMFPVLQDIDEGLNFNNYLDNFKIDYISLFGHHRDGVGHTMFRDNEINVCQ